MGKQGGIYIEGKAGNILYYSWKGIPCMRMIPTKVYQSEVVIAHKNANGLSTTMGGSFRRLLADIIPYPKNRQMQSAARLALLKWLKSGPALSQPPAEIPFISGLSFNEAAILNKCLRVPLTVSVTEQNKPVVIIPEITPVMDFTAPPGTGHIELKLAAACCNIHSGDALQNYIHHILIPYTPVSIPGQTISLPLQIPNGSITIVAASLEYYIIGNNKASLLPGEQFRPSEVIGGAVS